MRKKLYTRIFTIRPPIVLGLVCWVMLAGDFARSDEGDSGSFSSCAGGLAEFPQADGVSMPPDPVHIDQLKDIVFYTHNGDRLTLSDFQLAQADGVSERRPLLIFFGYASCPRSADGLHEGGVSCTHNLERASAWLEALDQEFGAGQSKIQIMYISLDPQRDTPQDIASYLHAFDNRITGLVPRVEDLQSLLSQWSIYAVRIAQNEDDYLIDHTSAVFVFAAEGDLVGLIGTRESQEEAVERLHGLFAQNCIRE